MPRWSDNNAYNRFQSTLPRRERLFSCEFLSVFHVFQSTLPRRERLLACLFETLFCLISIHAPAKGATVISLYQVIEKANFNPRSREGSDETRQYKFVRFKKFQSTLPRRERLETAGETVTDIRFQSTLPRRERQKKRKKILIQQNFNPRSREGSDITNNNDTDIYIDFNPRSREGSDLRVFSVTTRAIIFQSTLPRRERQQICTIFYYDIGISAQYYYIFLNKNNLMNSFKTNFNRFYYIFLVRISLHLHVKLLFAPHNTTLLT